MARLLDVRRSPPGGGFESRSARTRPRPRIAPSQWALMALLGVMIALVIWQMTDNETHIGLCGPFTTGLCVVKGDTLDDHGTRIQLRDIEAPELQDGRCPAERALGLKAARRLAELLNAGPFEIVDGSGEDHDQFGRALRLVQRDGQSLGDILVAEGLARRQGRRGRWC
jgi:hypothetical protein